MASLSGGNASNNSTDATTSRETKADTDTTTADSAFSNFLLDINLQKYKDALIEAGYDDFDCFDFSYTPVEEIFKDLVQEVKLKRPHAQKLLAKLRKRLADDNTHQQDQGLQNAPSVHPDDEDEDDLPIAHEVVAIGRSNASPVSAFDFTSMKKEMQDQMEADFNSRLDERLAEERVARERMEQEHIARLTDERAAIKKEMERERGAVEIQLREEMKQNEEASQAMIQEMKEEMERKKAIGNYISRGGGRTCACGADISVKPKNYTRCSNCFSSRSSTSSSSSSGYRSASRTCACGDDISDKPKNHTRCSNCFSGRNSTSSSSSGYRSASRTCDCGADISDKPMNHTRCSNCFSSRRSTSNSSNSSSGFGDGGPVTRSVTHCSQSLNKIRGIGPKSVAVLLLLNITTVPELQAKIKIHGAEWLRDNLPFGVNWRKVSQYLSDLY